MQPRLNIALKACRSAAEIINNIYKSKNQDDLMMIGILVGTYSSIFIASTSLLLLGANAEIREND